MTTPLSAFHVTGGTIRHDDRRAEAQVSADQAVKFRDVPTQRDLGSPHGEALALFSMGPAR